ncbi:hypothetical protein ACLB2K_031063 [Fragaria x ananassa]
MTSEPRANAGHTGFEFAGLPSFLSMNAGILVVFPYNRLHGAIPSSFFQQAWNLTSFNVSNNTFSGPIPSSICRHSSSLLRHLDFSLNNFNGSISRGFRKCSKLQVFRAGNNYLSGSLPEEIYNATTVEEISVISLPLNSLSGAMSDGIANLINLSTLDLSYNQLSGVLPLHLGKLSKLKRILLDFNYLEGSLPLSLMNCTKLVELRMGANNLGGNISMLDFSKLSQLSKLDLRKNNFFGVFPRSIYSCKLLKAIRVNYNNLEVQIQPEILSLKSLSFLSLGMNKRLTNVKEAMKILMGCKRLVVLSLASSFAGEEFPTDLGRAGFDGFQNLRVLDLSSCNLTGKIPKELWMLPMLVSDQAAAQVDLTAIDLPIFYPSVDHSRPLQYNYLYYEASISLKSNNLHGNIPSEIGRSQLLTILYLSDNNISGNIPEQIANLKGMQILDLSMNQLSGNIPASFTSLHFLSKFNVSYNHLEGPIPSSTQLQSFDASAFEGNLKLCGDPLPNKCKRTEGTDEPDINNTDADMEQQFPWFFVSAALGFIIGFWGVFGPSVFLQKWRYAYYHFLDNVHDRFMVMIAKSMARVKRRRRSDDARRFTNNDDLVVRENSSSDDDDSVGSVTGYWGNSGDRSPAVGQIPVTGVRRPVIGVPWPMTGVREHYHQSFFCGGLLRQHPENLFSFDHINKSRHLALHLTSIKWHGPTHEVVNFDGSVVGDSATRGFVIRDSFGNPIVAGSRMMEKSSVPVAEALALRLALYMPKPMGKPGWKWKETPS